MVARNRFFLIDGSFILHSASEAFHACSLFVRNGINNTITFGFLRHILRLRMQLGIRSGLIILGESAHTMVSLSEIEVVQSLLRALSFPLICDPRHRELEIFGAQLRERTCIVATDLKFLQLAREGVVFVFQKGVKDFDIVASDAVISKIGVEPKFVSTLLALMNADTKSQITKNQAIRLIEDHGTLSTIFDNIGKIKSKKLRDKLSLNRKAIERTFNEAAMGERTCVPVPKDLRSPAGFEQIDHEKNVRLLEDLQFFSLCRRLGPPGASRIQLDGHKVVEKRSYEAIVTMEGLRRLREKVSEVDLCAIDTESSGRDPHTADLYGVSFCFAVGEAYYVPVTEADLKGIEQAMVLGTLREIVAQPVRFIGHNIKYDYVLLHRNRIRIPSIDFDTLLAANDCYGDWTYFNLPALSERLLGKKITSYSDIVQQNETLLDIPFKKVVQHACQDAEVTFLLYRRLNNELHKRGVFEQHITQTISMCKVLCELECKGVKVNLERLKALRTTLMKNVLSMRREAHESVGYEFDLDSYKELAQALSTRDSIRRPTSPASLSRLASLEKLACTNPLARTVVRYKRLKRDMMCVDSIIRNVRDGTVRPTFSMVKSRYGAVRAARPDVFGKSEIKGLRDCFCSDFRSLFPESARAVDFFQDVTNDSCLHSDRANIEKRNVFITGNFDIEHPRSDRFLLLLVIGYSCSSLSREFLVDEIPLSAFCSDIEKRYWRMFQWIVDFRSKMEVKGFAEFAGRFKYFDGLHSSDLNKRESALRYGIRWLIQY